MTKAAKERLLKSKFFHEVEAVIEAWDCYLAAGEDELAKRMMYKWTVARLALEHITGNLYGFSRNGETYSVVNERDYGDVLLAGRSRIRQRGGT